MNAEILFLFIFDWMNKNLQLLQHLANKPERRILGLMSGTSLDGLDLALCRISGSGLQTRLELEFCETHSYTESFKAELRSVFAQEQVSLQKLTLLNAFIGTYHAELVLQSLAKWRIKPKDVDAIASHGQTVYHAPKYFHQQAGFPNATLQIGDGDHLAVKTGILTLSDFRQKHIAAGGEGAPLVPYGDYLLFSSADENRILVNLGGIANFTYLPQGGDPKKVVASDIGPANTLIDAALREYFNLDFDKDGQIARKGNPNTILLNALMQHPFIAAALPKTTGPEMFKLTWVKELMENLDLRLSPEDLICTLTEFTARVLALNVQTNFDCTKTAIYFSGGGLRNLFLMERIGELLSGFNCQNLGVLGLNPDAKEAALFAVLANETLVGEPFGLGEFLPVSLGKISFPY